MTIFERLAAQFPPDAISWRVGSTNGEKTKGLALAYIDARDVMDRLDAVVGPANWSDAYVETSKGVMLCTLSLRLGGEWISKCDGAGATDVEAEKGQVSDALKRAAVKWGIGRYLYNLPTVWVEIEQRGRSSVITEAGYKRLQDTLRNFARQASQAPLAGPAREAKAAEPVPEAPQPHKPTERIDPETGEITSDNQPAARGYIPPGQHIKTPEEKAAAKKAADAKAAEDKQMRSTEARESLLDRFREYYRQAQQKSRPANQIAIDFNALKQTFNVCKREMSPSDIAAVNKAALQVADLLKNLEQSAKGKAA